MIIIHSLSTDGRSRQQNACQIIEMCSIELLLNVLYLACVLVPFIKTVINLNIY